MARMTATAGERSASAQRKAAQNTARTAPRTAPARKPAKMRSRERRADCQKKAVPASVPRERRTAAGPGRKSS